MNIWLIIKREIKTILLKDRKSILLLFGVPIIYVLLFGSLYKENSVNYIPTVIYDQDQTQLSRTITNAFEDAQKFKVVAHVSSTEDLEAFMQNKEAFVAVSIPPNLASDIKTGHSSQVMVTINGSNIVLANSALSASSEIISTVSGGISKKLIEAKGKLPDEAIKKAAPISLGLRVINNPTYAYTNFVLAGLGANGLQIALILVICPLFNREYHRLTSLGAISSASIIIGKLLVYWLCGMIIFAIYTLISIYLFHLPCKSSFENLLFIGSAYIFTIISIAFFVGAIAPDEVKATTIPLLYILPALLFSGYIWPQLAMNTFSEVFASIAPIAYMADNVRDLMLNGHAPNMWHDSLVLYIWGLVLLILANFIFNFRRSKSRIGQE